MTISHDSRQAVDVFVLPSAALYSGHSSSWLTYVGIEEQAKAATYRNREDAVDYAAMQTLMRCIAASALDVRPTQASEIPVDRSCLLCNSGELHGKPRIDGIALNMSRTNGMVAGGFSRKADTVLGIDIQKMRGNYYAGFDNIALTASEKELVLSYPISAQHLMRLMLWTAKEAVLKATGYGLSISPSSVEVDLSALPEERIEPCLFSAQAQLTLPGQEVRPFEINWQPHIDYVVAVATTEPSQVKLHAVTAPVEVKRVVQKPLFTGF